MDEILKCDHLNETYWACFFLFFFCPERFFSGYSGLPLSSKTNISKFQFDQNSGRRRTALWKYFLYIVIYLFILSYPILSYPVLSCPVLSCPVLSCPVLSCPVLSCPVLSCPVLSYLILLLIYLFIYLFYLGGNPCQPKAGSTSCSHVCLLAPKDSYPDGCSCHCPPGLFLLYDNKTCDTSGNIIIIEM